jgi:nitrogen fixation NifU-like protein
MVYSVKLLDYFENPRCVGELEDANGTAEISNPVCGDSLKLWVRVDDGKIADARFKAQGCPAAIATSSFATEMIIGMEVDQARALTREEIADALGGLPASKIHCSVLASEAIQSALKDF